MYTRQDLEIIAERYARQRGLAPWLVKSVIEQESRWKPDAYNASSATGLMQVHKSNWGRFKVRKEDLLDPEKNIEVGTAILKQELDNAGGDVASALIAYNAGAGRLKNFNEGNKIKQSGELLRAETEAYVPEVFLRMAKYGGPKLSAEDYTKLRARLGSRQTNDADIQKRAGVFVEGDIAAAKEQRFPPFREKEPIPSLPAMAAAQDVQTPDLSQLPDQGLADMLPKITEPQKQEPQKVQRTLAQVFGGQDIASDDYPDWMRSLVKEFLESV